MLLVRNDTATQAHAPRKHGADLVSGIDLSDVLAFFRRQRLTIVAAIAACAVLAAAYVILARPRFTADALVLIEPRKTRLVQGKPAPADAGAENAFLDSQVEIARSSRVVLKVIADLGLGEDPELSAVATGAVARLTAALRGVISPFPREGEHAVPLSEARHQAVLENFDRNLAVRRIGLTHVLRISYTANDPHKAAQIANGVALAYITDELRARDEADKLAGGWLEGRVRELREQAIAADHAVQRYRLEHNIIETGRGLVDEQQLYDVNGQLVLARATTAEARARLERISDILRQRDVEAVVTDALRNDVISGLRSRLLETIRTEADLTRHFGPEHGAAARLREEIAGLRHSIFAELNRIAEAYRSEYEVAKARETSLEGSLKSLVARAAIRNEAQIALRDLERTAQTSRAVYETFLTRLKEAAQEHSFPLTEARVITEATPPLRKSQPRTAVILGGAICFGLLAGIGAGLLRERRDRTFRTVDQLERETGLTCLGIVPHVSTPRSMFGSKQHSLLQYATEAPTSCFARSIQSTKIALDIAGLGRNIRVIGVVSAFPGEGVTTIANNLARAAALSGHKVLLIDANLQEAPPGKDAISTPEPGLYHLAVGGDRLESLVKQDSKIPLSILPAGAKGVPNAPDILSSPPVRDLLGRGNAEYGVIVVDLPPLATAADARAISPVIDAFLLIVAWGRTPQDILSSAPAGSDLVFERLVGCIMNDVDPRRVRRFSPKDARAIGSLQA